MAAVPPLPSGHLSHATWAAALQGQIRKDYATPKDWQIRCSASRNRWYRVQYSIYYPRRISPTNTEAYDVFSATKLCTRFSVPLEVSSLPSLFFIILFCDVLRELPRVLSGAVYKWTVYDEIALTPPDCDRRAKFQAGNAKSVVFKCSSVMFNTLYFASESICFYLP